MPGGAASAQIYISQVLHLKEYYKDLEYRLHHCLSKFDRSVFLNLKPNCFFGVYMAWFLYLETIGRDLNKGGAIAPPHFGTIEGAAGQRRRAALLLAPPL